MTLTFIQRKASNFLLESIAKQSKSLEELPQNVWYFRDLIELNVIKHNHPGNLKSKNSAPTLQRINNAIDAYWINSRLANNWNAWLEATFFGTMNAELKAYLMQPVQQAALIPDLAGNPFTQAYSLALTTALEDKISIADFEQIQENALKVLVNAEQSELTGVFNMMVNYLQLTINKEGEQHLPKLMQLYMKGLEVGALYKHGYIGYGDFTAMVHIACKCGKLNLAEEIITNQAPFLEESEKEAAIRISRVRLAFHKEDYREALRILNQNFQLLSDTDKLYDKVMRILCYYETKDLDLLDAALEALRKFSKRRPMLAGKYFEPLSKFIRLLKRLAIAEDQEELKAINQEANLAPKSAYHAWLQSKIDEKLG
jgi:hypothetical protein